MPQPRYKYSPLSENEIRLMTLLPGGNDSQIRVALTTIIFTSDTNVDFEALSYTWGSTENKVDIFVGETCNDALSVTRNLAQALPYLRYVDKPRVLWIDAISVNQEDLDERSSQVKRMPNIYSRATRVLIWLGLESFDSRMAFDCLRLVASKYHVNRGNFNIIPIMKDASLWAVPGQALPLSEQQYRSILNLINRDWFERLWVCQEAHLANQDALVICGTDSILWQTIGNTMVCLQSKPCPLHIFSALAKRHDAILFLFRKISRIYRLSLFIEETKDFKCADPRDKIYALLGLLSIEDQLEIEPDYTKPVYEVYREVTLKLIHNTHILVVLQGIELNDSNKVHSWVPDWTTSRVAVSFVGCNASNASSAECIAGPGDLLQVTGKLVSRISQIEAIKITRFDVDSSKLVTQLRSIASKSSLLDNFPGPPDYIPALCEVLCSNQFAEQYRPLDLRKVNILETERFLRTVFETQDHIEGLGVENRITGKLELYCHGRSLFVTEDGRLGLAPQAAQPGDIVTVLLGCDSCIILRPVTLQHTYPSKQQYRVVGEAYCHGFMQGEAILGPLPPGFEAVEWYNENSGGVEWAYVNLETAHTDVNDPRLGALPEPWKRQRRTEEGAMYRYFLNEETGEETVFDPRLKADALRAMGVELDVFDLV
ncbi:heterokaryon incompatibility protein-domain-containing protein [Rhexocercosporidium sp. MPI-PUGE-AT-0058]|nr:heterokaryon incompatibility protein-domain-containing protein [Rhexocercosporidium sp. MPI-PUGE-AT-0058]